MTAIRKIAMGVAAAGILVAPIHSQAQETVPDPFENPDPFANVIMPPEPGGRGQYLKPSEVLLPGTSSTGDSLRDYDFLVVTAFREAYGPDVRARAVVTPSFMPEFVVGIRETDGNYSVFKLEAMRQLWGYSLMDMFASGEIIATDLEGNNRNQAEIEDLDANLPDDFLDVELDRCEAVLKRDLGDRLLQIWLQMLSQTGEDGGGVGLHGTSYRFEMGERAGETWSPPGKAMRVF